MSCVLFAQNYILIKIFRPIAISGYPICRLLCMLSIFLILIFIFPMMFRTYEADIALLRNIHIIIVVTIFYIWLIGMNIRIITFIPIAIMYSILCIMIFLGNISVILYPYDAMESLTLMADNRVNYHTFLLFTMVALIFAIRFIKDKYAYAYFLFDIRFYLNGDEEDIFGLIKSYEYGNTIFDNVYEKPVIYKNLQSLFSSLKYPELADGLEKLITLEKDAFELKNKILFRGNESFLYKDYEQYKSCISRFKCDESNNKK